MGLLCKAEKLLHSRPCGRLGRRKKPRERGGAASLKIRHSITQKLVSIIAVLLTVSISAITGMVSVLVSADVGLTAEDNNFSINKRTAASTQIILSNIRSAARIFLINARENADSTFFFTENADIACVGITDGRNTPVIFRNEPFFLAHDLHENIIQNYLLESGDALDRAWAGESLMLNASPSFGTQLIALLFLIDRERVAFAFVSTEKLLKSFGQELNISFLINDDGDVLAHPDGKLVEGGANVSNIPYIQGLLENSGVNTNIQTRFVDSNGGEYISAYQKINFQGELDSGSAILITIIAVKTVFQGIVDTTRRNI
ncbi:MAG: hypothetical protein LBC72_05295, partial [Spirochaetaceae bacterium]|nr:hypothetical protein [Spirochaetaceae bacterium]